MANINVDDEELVEQIRDEAGKAVALCSNGKRDLVEMTELLQYLIDFNYQAERADASQQPTEPPVPAVRAAIRPPLSNRGFHISSKVIVESTRSRPKPGIKPAAEQAAPAPGPDDTVVLSRSKDGKLIDGAPSRPSQTDLPAVSQKHTKKP